MSLFNELQGQLIEKPEYTYSYRNILKEKKTDEDKKKEWKELCAKKKKKMSKEEYNKWRQKEWYKRNKKKRGELQLEWYYRNKAEEEAMIEEIYKDVYSQLPEPVNWDKYYTEKFKKDDMIGGEYRFAWRSSRLMRISWKRTPKQREPFRISYRHAMCVSNDRLYNAQVEAYKYLKPHLEEIRGCKYALAKKQYIYAPIYYLDEPMRTIINEAPVPNHRAIYVADGMLRGKFMVSELYLGRDSFIFGDVLVTQTGKTYRIALENNLPWLTKDTVEEIHALRMDWRKNKGEKAPPIYIVNDAYLIKVPINERENLYYIVPT